MIVGSSWKIILLVEVTTVIVITDAGFPEQMSAIESLPCPGLQVLLAHNCIILMVDSALLLVHL